MVDAVVKSSYRPPTKGGRIELKIGDTWCAMLLGASSYSISGGDRTSSDQEYIDLDTDSATTSAGTKNLAITCTPSWLDEFYRRVLEDGFYKNQQLQVRFRTLAGITPVQSGDSDDTAAILATGAVTFAGTGPAASAVMDLRSQLNYGLLLGPPGNTGVAAITQDNDDNLGNLFIVSKVDDTAMTATAQKYDRSTITPVAASENWKLIQHGICFELGMCDILSAGNPDISSDGRATETISFQQTAARPLIIKPVIEATT